MEKEDAEQEWELSTAIKQKIANLPLQRNYLSIAETMCVMDRKQTDRDIKTKCEIAQTTARKDLRLLQIPYAGKPIKNYALPPSFDLLPFMIHLLEAGALLTQNGIVHFDIHANNILLDTHQVPRLIDFNLSKDIANITEDDFRYEYHTNLHVNQQPPELTMVVGIHEGLDIDTILTDLTEKKMTTLLQRILHVQKGQIAADYTRLYNDPLIRKGDVLGWFHAHWTKFDSWGIGVYLLRLIASRIAIPSFSMMLQRNWSVIRKVLTKLVAIVPQERWDSIQALQELHQNSVMIRRYKGLAPTT